MWGKEIDSGGTEVMGYDYGKQLVTGIYIFNHQQSSWQAWYQLILLARFLILTYFSDNSNTL